MSISASPEASGDRPASSRLRAWLELLRVPNLFTVPGDVVAGWALAHGGMGAPSEAWRLAAIAGASLLIYLGGVVLNDVVDVRDDRRERPARPIPSGRVSRGAAAAAAVILLSCGIGLSALAGVAPLVAGGALILLVVAYDGWAKRVPGIGEVVMGSCRGANILFGASAAWGDPATASGAGAVVVVAAAGTALVYIAAVSVIARREMEAAPGPLRRAAPAVLLAAGITAVLWLSPSRSPLAIGLAAASVAAVALVCARMRDVPRGVGALIGLLIVIQATLILTGSPESLAAAAGILLFWPAGRIARRWFYAS